MGRGNLKRDWRSDAVPMLREGLGVEDISIRLDVDMDQVRRLVDAMRSSGRMSEIHGSDKTRTTPRT